MCSQQGCLGEIESLLMGFHSRTGHDQLVPSVWMFVSITVITWSFLEGGIFTTKDLWRAQLDFTWETYRPSGHQTWLAGKSLSHRQFSSRSPSHVWLPNGETSCGALVLPSKTESWLLFPTKTPKAWYMSKHAKHLEFGFWFSINLCNYQNQTDKCIHYDVCCALPIRHGELVYAYMIVNASCRFIHLKSRYIIYVHCP